MMQTEAGWKGMGQGLIRDLFSILWAVRSRPSLLNLKRDSLNLSK